MASQSDSSFRRPTTGNVFIKNLDRRVDVQTIYNIFSPYGKILSYKIARDENGKSKGFAFVQFETERAAHISIEEVNGMRLRTRRIFVGPFIPRAVRDRYKINPFTNVYVKNFGDDFDDYELEKMFQPYGKITSLKVMTTEDGRSKGFGFVAFETVESANTAINCLNGKVTPNGKVLYVGSAQKKDERKEELRRQFHVLQKKRQDSSRGFNVYVRNLSQYIDDERLHKEFSVFGTITSVRVITNEDGHSKGFGFVCFSSRDAATRAINEMNARLLDSKPLYVAEYVTRRRQESPNEKPPYQDKKFEKRINNAGHLRERNESIIDQERNKFNYYRAGERRI